MSRFADILATLGAGFSSLADPASNPVAAVFALAILVLGLLLFILLVFLALASFGGAPEPARRPAPAEDARARRRRVTAQIVLIGVLAVAATVAWSYGVSDPVCARCHFTQGAVESHAESSHGAIACTSCHVAPGLANGALARARGVRNAFVSVAGQAPAGPVDAYVANAACVGCHTAVIEGTTLARSVRMRHSDVLAAGYVCVDCHNTEGHGTSVRKPAYPRMSQCITCHDDTTAPSGCETCHSKDVGVAVRRLKRPFAQVVTSREDCRGCHAIESCNECHGLELPHSDEFEEGFHARKAFRDPGVCFKCHDLNVFCNDECHNFKVSPDGTKPTVLEHDNLGDFRSWHRQNKPGVQQCFCHDDDRERFCNWCHGLQPER